MMFYASIFLSSDKSFLVRFLRGIFSESLFFAEQCPFRSKVRRRFEGLRIGRIFYGDSLFSVFDLFLLLVFNLHSDVVHENIFYIQSYSLGNIIKIMRLRHPINEQSLTGEVPQPMTSTAMYHRVNSIKNRTLGRSFNVKKSQADIHGQL